MKYQSRCNSRPPGYGKPSAKSQLLQANENGVELAPQDVLVVSHNGFPAERKQRKYFRQTMGATAVRKIDFGGAGDVRRQILSLTPLFKGRILLGSYSRSQGIARKLEI